MACVLFVCLHNAGRSQMSQALLERAADGRHTALSAGTTPAEHVHPEVVESARSCRSSTLAEPEYQTIVLSRCIYARSDASSSSISTTPATRSMSTS